MELSGEQIGKARDGLVVARHKRSNGYRLEPQALRTESFVRSLYGSDWLVLLW
jgi:hypothetical protein